MVFIKKMKAVHENLKTTMFWTLFPVTLDDSPVTLDKISISCSVEPGSKNLAWLRLWIFGVAKNQFELQHCLNHLVL